MTSPTSSARPRLRVLAWDHPRCLRPLAAAREPYRVASGVDVEVGVRSLAGFGDDVPAGDEFDVVLIDHPHIGQAAAAGQIHALDDLLEADVLAERLALAVGPSGASYVLDGHAWAVPVDAASHALACAHELEPPASVAEVLALAEARPGRVAIPLQPAHALSAFVSVAAALGAADAVGGFHDAALATATIEALALVAAAGPRAACDWDPPAALAQLEAGAVDCVPWTYGYVGYDVQWANAPAETPAGVPGSILGGVGMAVMAASVDPVAAAAFAAWFGSSAVQQGIVAAVGGQPAEAGAWEATPDPLCCHTRRSLDCAVVRPCAAWWPAFQHAAGDLLHSALRAGAPAADTAAQLLALYDHRLEPDHR